MKIKYQYTGIVDVIQIVFVILKLTNNIDWSWWWVLSPMIIVFLFHFIGDVYFND